MAPRRDEISPSMAERDLLTSEPALIESRALAAPTASSINSLMGSDSGKDRPSCSSCLRRFSMSALPTLRRRSSSLIRSRACSALRSSSSICWSGTDISPTSLSFAPPGALCVHPRLYSMGGSLAMLYSPESGEVDDVGHRPRAEDEVGAGLPRTVHDLVSVRRSRRPACCVAGVEGMRAIFLDHGRLARNHVEELVFLFVPVPVARARPRLQR